MRARFILYPYSALSLIQPAHAEIYLSIEQAQKLMFPGAVFTQTFVTLSETQVSAIEHDSGVDVRDSKVRAWRTSTGGWFIADEVMGKHEFIPFALALDADGRVKGVEILEYRESYGGKIRNPAWRAQFVGKTHGATLELGQDIKNISGATLSSKHITDGVKRLLATYAVALAGH
ncbi:MAG: FMN-binding protein [Alphaproteobacteria bacterium]|nr:FMN-binding protein [Alphaproteobacteria bacterium]